MSRTVIVTKTITFREADFFCPQVNGGKASTVKGPLVRRALICCF
jgi:hypothetical protein